MRKKLISTGMFLIILIAINITCDLFLKTNNAFEKIWFDLLVPLIPTLIYSFCLIKEIKRRPLILVIAYLLIFIGVIVLKSGERGLFTLNVFVTKLSFIPGIFLNWHYLENKLLFSSTFITMTVLYLVSEFIDRIIFKK